MKSKLSKSEAEKQIKDILSKNPSPEKIKKAKKLAMSKNIKLGSLKKLYCKKCHSLFDSKNSSIRIKNGYKTIKCKNCEFVTRWKI
ncbi:MAG: hypothetical protein WC438_01525 [Candidatus Pacearchaeota archaeon]